MAEQTTARAEILRSKDFLGWEVRDRSGEKLGTVGDLLADRSGSIRFLHVEHGLPRKHLLLPVEELEWGEDAFVLERWTKDQVKAFPPYDPALPLSAPVLEEMRRAFPWLYGGDASWRSADASELRVVPLSEAKDFKLGANAPDPKGWNVFGADGERLGTVAQLLVDPGAMKVRYLDVDVLDDLFLLRDDRHVLVPLEYVELKERGNDAWVQGLSAAEAARLPAYPGGAVPPALERAVAEPFNR